VKEKASLSRCDRLAGRHWKTTAIAYHLPRNEMQVTAIQVSIDYIHDIGSPVAVATFVAVIPSPFQFFEIRLDAPVIMAFRWVASLICRFDCNRLLHLLHHQFLLIDQTPHLVITTDVILDTYLKALSYDQAWGTVAADLPRNEVVSPFPDDNRRSEPEKILKNLSG
jgi:hypothetical protein